MDGRWRHFWIMIIHLKELCLLLIGPISQVCIGKASWKKMHGTTVSRLRNGSFLHHFPSALPCGARTRDQSGSSQSYCILDCIFQEVSKTCRWDFVLLMSGRQGNLIFDSVEEEGQAKIFTYCL
ncbi:uncharacterized protein LOC116107911 isoform X2 [Pistacia vera]|uniref:uncharacterized protein LOC116107911 isoform X2 n=1 Tax=Pistacia vera TaxID=55513 RepID=UPI0012634C51|nr:uncharacterized protein LOC116107911 isoform X2 [Pistacia vera]XP_031250045.1 uncharacterized protein LOC116107911 isoform X2 [Pistacia vera]